MQTGNVPCPPVDTLREKSWEYSEYYVGEKDKGDQRNGKGENHWSGAKSLEWYTGNFIRDTMHGTGDYFWRLRGPEGNSGTYEGYFYCNRFHGYGTMSYSDGRTFTGLFYNNMRWGPGVQSHAGAHQDVGLWHGVRLVRLAWRPAAPSIVPEFTSTSSGRALVDSHRVMLTTKVKTVGEINYALELLKNCGADPRIAVEKWSKLYPRYCTDLASPLFYKDAYDREYYKKKIYTLQEVEGVANIEQDDRIDEDVSLNTNTYFAWNNNNMVIDMMKHSYKHERQRYTAMIDLKSILSGPRKQFKPAAAHEIDCRTLLMAAYLGHIADVAQLINEGNVHPDICDVQGNTAIMYATCGNQPEVIHFLIEAGANVDFCNDCCCTPLGMALIRYICIQKDVSPNDMLQALLPPPSVPAPESMASDWNITRDQINSTGGILNKSASKTARNMSSRKIKSLLSIRDQLTTKRKTDLAQLKALEPAYDSDDSISEDKRLYNDINREFFIKVSDSFKFPRGSIPISYIFDVNNMIKEIEVSDEDQKKLPEKGLKKNASKIIKETIKTSKELMWPGGEKEDASISSVDKEKMDMLAKTKLTILQLLTDGANPRSIRFPQPALFIAVLANSPDLIHHLVRCGADVNEVYVQVFNYSPLDVAVSRPLSYENLEVIRALLECGADAKHRLVYQLDVKDYPNADTQIPGPTLLHAAVAKKTENEIEEDIRRQLMELLIKYKCDPIMWYRGRSAIDMAMNKSIDLLDVFIKHSSSDLNRIINDSNQCILVKMFNITFFKNIASSERLQLFTNLLLYGADPLMKCQNGEDTYENIFVFAKKTLNEMESSHTKPLSPPTKNDPKKVEKPKKEEKLATKSMGRMAFDDVEDYRQAVELLTDCARLIYIRWLQTKLLKELIVIIDKYKHRHWSVILKECKATRATGLWLTPQRCLEIWDILSSTKRKIYKDPRTIKHLVGIVIFMSWQNFGHSPMPPGKTLTAVIKDAIEADATRLLRQYKVDKKMASDLVPWKLSYIKPELVKDEKKFNVCFECIMPLTEEKILCCWCKEVSFCSYECIKSNITRANCHPCSDVLKMKYFPDSDDSVQEHKM